MSLPKKVPAATKKKAADMQQGTWVQPRPQDTAQTSANNAADDASDGS